MGPEIHAHPPLASHRHTSVLLSLSLFLSFMTAFSSCSSGLFSGIHMLKNKCISQNKKKTFFSWWKLRLLTRKINKKLKNTWLSSDFILVVRVLQVVGGPGETQPS